MANPASSSTSSGSSGTSSSGGGGGDSALRTFENAFDRFSTGVHTLALTSQIAQKRLEVEFSSLDSCVNRHTAQLQEYRKLEDMLDELDAQAKEGTDAQLHDYRLKLQLLKSALDKLKETKPRIDNGLFVRLMYGRVNIALWKQADRLMFKDEYNKFKSRTTLLFLLWPCLQLVLMYVFPDFWRSQGELLLKIHQLWLLYYYLTLSLRENILLANGSDILHWWIYHHYISMFISAVMLLFPNAYLIQSRLIEMMVFGAAQGFVMVFQNNYQKKRLYTRKALGKAKAIDVDSTETLQEKPSDLKILIPMLFLLYAMEFWFGGSFIYHYLVDRYDTRPFDLEYPVSVLLMGVAFIVLGLGNAYSTGIVLVSKSKSRQLKHEIKERATGAGVGREATNARNNQATSVDSAMPTTQQADKKAD